jgi:hypothetical protein
VVFVPVMQPGKLKSIPFQALYDGYGHAFPTDNRKNLVNKLELYHDGKMYDVKLQLAD